MDGTAYWIAQAVGTLAALIGIAAFQLRRDGALFLALAASAFVWAIHFVILAAAAAAAINVVTGLRNLSGMWIRSRAVGLLFAAGYVAAAAWYYESAWDLLPLFAVLSGTAAVFFVRGLWVRGCFLAGSVLWVIFNIHAGSLPGIAMMAADGASNLIFILRRLSGRTADGPPPADSGTQGLWRRVLERRKDPS